MRQNPYRRCWLRPRPCPPALQPLPLNPFNPYPMSLLDAATAEVRRRLDEMEAQLDALDGAQAGETKSSAGDKFETSREMMQQERDRLEAQAAVMRGHHVALEVAARREGGSVVGLGSEVAMETGERYLVATGLGKVRLAGGGVAWVISPESPLGAALVGKGVGEAVVVRGREMVIIGLR